MFQIPFLRAQSHGKSNSRGYKRLPNRHRTRRLRHEPLEERQLLAVYANTTEMPIPDPGTITSQISVSDAGVIQDLDVTLTIEHTRVEDLDVHLIAPGGTRVQLFTDVVGRGDNFIDTTLFRRDREPCYRSTLADPDEKILMHVSNFRPVKRVVDVVEIFERVSREIPSRLVMVGDGPERARAQARAEELGVADRTLFLGAHQSVHDLLRCADVFLLPSQNESFGLAALEAMACGTPVVASDRGGIPEVVPHAEAGYLFPLGEVEAMAEGAMAILKDPLKWKRMSEGARRGGWPVRQW